MTFQKIIKGTPEHLNVFLFWYELPEFSLHVLEALRFTFIAQGTAERKAQDNIINAATSIMDLYYRLKFDIKQDLQEHEYHLIYMFMIWIETMLEEEINSPEFHTADAAQRAIDMLSTEVYFDYIQSLQIEQVEADHFYINVDLFYRDEITEDFPINLN